MTLAEFFNFVFTALIVYGVIGLGLFVLAGHNLADLWSHDALNYVLYWPIILRDALAGYMPSF
jgi:hypothetical protein